MDKAIRYFPWALVFFHTIGIGMFLYMAKAPDYSYMNIFLSAMLVLFSEKIQLKSLLVFGVIFLSGYLIELIGVQTGLLFGSYVYLDAMGPLIFGTPIIIGATWYAVVVGAVSIIRPLKLNIFWKAVMSGILATVMDLLIEQVAMNYGLWQWEGDTVPLYNYICWFLFGSLFAFIYLKSTVNQNQTARYLYWIWLLFFLILTIAV